MTDDNDIKQKLDELHAAYLSQLPQRVQELDGLWQRFKNGDRSVLPQLTYEVHRLAGSGASFGLPISANRRE